MDLILVGLGSLFVFYAIGNAPFLRWLVTALSRLHPMLPHCPWCLGAWVAAPLSVLATWGSLGVRTVLVWLAGSAVCGVLGSLVPDEGGVDG